MPQVISAITVKSLKTKEEYDNRNFIFFNDLEKRFLIRNNYIFKFYRKNVSGTEYWLCKRCLKHSVTIDKNLIIAENPHSLDSDNEDTCCHTDDELLCLKSLVKIRKRCLEEITPVQQIYDDQLAELNEIIDTQVISRYFPSFMSIRTTFFNIRKIKIKKKLPNIPKNTSDIEQPSSRKQTKKKNFYCMILLIMSEQ